MEPAESKPPRFPAVSQSVILCVWSSAFTRPWDRLKAELQTKRDGACGSEPPRFPAVSQSVVLCVWSSAFTRPWDRLKAELQTKRDGACGSEPPRFPAVSQSVVLCVWSSAFTRPWGPPEGGTSNQAGWSLPKASRPDFRQCPNLQFFAFGVPRLRGLGTA